MQLPVVVEYVTPWAQLSRQERQDGWRAAARLVGSMQALSGRGEQIVQAMIAGRDVIEWEHYPDNDVRDDKNASQYFYHCHGGLQRPFQEHGHFHLFVHPQTLGMRRGKNGSEPSPAHLLAVSMDAQGVPCGFFIVNRWVVKGPWLSYAHCVRGLQHFQIKGRRGTKEINHFLPALLTLYRLPILRLLQQRDAVLEQLCQGRDRRTVFADKEIEVLCHLPITLMDDIAALEESMHL